MRGSAPWEESRCLIIIIRTNYSFLLIVKSYFLENFRIIVQSDRNDCADGNKELEEAHQAYQSNRVNRSNFSVNTDFCAGHYLGEVSVLLDPTRDGRESSEVEMVSRHCGIRIINGVVYPSER